MYFTKVRWFNITAPLVAFAATILIVPAAHAQTAWADIKGSANGLPYTNVVAYVTSPGLTGIVAWSSSIATSTGNCLVSSVVSSTTSPSVLWSGGYGTQQTQSIFGKTTYFLECYDNGSLVASDSVAFDVATSGTSMIGVSSVQSVNSQLAPNTSVIGQLTTSGTTAIVATGYSMTLNADAQLTVGAVYKYPGGTSPVSSRAWCPKSGQYNFCKVTNIAGGGPIDLSGGGSGNPTVRLLTVGYQWCKEVACLTGSAKVATVNAYATSVLPKYASYNQLRQHFVTEVDCAYGTLSGYGVNVLVTPQTAISSVTSSIQGINQCYVSYATSIVGKPGNTVTFESATLILGFKPNASSTSSQTLGASSTEFVKSGASTSRNITEKSKSPLISLASATDAIMALTATSSGTSTPPTGTTTPPTATTTPLYGANIVTNSGFENQKNNWSGWGTRTKLVTTEKHSGTYGMEFVHTTSGTRALNNGVTYAVVPGSKVLASAYVKTVGAGTTDAFLELEWRTAGGSILKRDQVAYTGGATAWTKIEKTLTVPANATKLKIHLKDMATPSVGSVFFDDISVQLAETVTAREGIFNRMLSNIFTIVEAVSASR